MSISGEDEDLCVLVRVGPSAGVWEGKLPSIAWSFFLGE